MKSTNTQRTSTQRASTKRTSTIFRQAALATVACALVTIAATAQQVAAYATALPFDRGAAGLAQSLRKLGTRASLIQINAHPDDEDGGMLAYESRGVGAEVSLLSLNRGEGGQNVMTGDFWDSLGILRTQEHLAANYYYGVNLYYTRVADFGFSKTLDEAFKSWGHERVLRDTVRVVRATRPMVVTSVFSGNVSDGHGHHQVSGVMAQEVYSAAGDPKMFPELLKEGLRPWTPLKVYARSPFARATPQGVYDYATGKYEPMLYKNYVDGTTMDHVPEATVTVPEGQYNALFGESYLQVAREGLNQQKSQNGGVGTPPPSKFDSGYHLYASRVSGATLPKTEAGFFDGIDTSLQGIAGYLPAEVQAAERTKLAAIEATVAEATALFDANDPAKSAPALARGLTLTRALIAEMHDAKAPEDARYNAVFELQLKERQFNTALAQSLGFTMQAALSSGPPVARAGGGPGPGATEVGSQTVIAGETFGVMVHLADQGNAAVQLNSVTLRPASGDAWKLMPQGAAPTSLAAGTGADVFLKATAPADAPLTRPYFSRPNVEQNFYDIQDERALTQPDAPFPLEAVASYTFAGTEASLTQVVQTTQRIVGFGTVQQPLVVAPAIGVLVGPQSGVLPLNAASLQLRVTIHSSVKGPAKGTVRLELPKGWTAQPASADFTTQRDNEDAVLPFTVTTPGLKAQPYTVTAVADYAGKKYTEGFTTIGYAGIRPYPRYSAATSRVTGVDMKVAPGLRVGYVTGTGDDVPESLRQMGIDPVLLSDAELQGGDLTRYDCIVLGVRTYTARPALRLANSRLLDYVRNGGIVINQYQSAEFDHNYAPYPLSVQGDQAHTVVEEDAKVTITKPTDAMMTWPNRIAPADFDNWVEERGHGFPVTFSADWTSTTEVHDTDQDPQLGGILYAKAGKGYYVYLAYAFFREMPESVPGPFRIMANLLSMAKNPGLTH